MVYSTNLQDHIQQVKMVFDVLRTNQLYTKKSKCKFGAREVEYLGHFISATGVSVDYKKFQVIIESPTPKNLKALRGFLGLTGYYRKFISSTLVAPLIALTKKHAFHWTTKARGYLRS